ncbi:MAG: SRPBCC domain-containing protein [Telluria sp.]
MNSPVRSTYVYVTFIRTSPEQLWEAVTQEEFIKKFWFGMSLSTNWEIGSAWALTYPDGRLADAGYVTEYSPMDGFALSWRNEWSEELREEGFGTLRLKIEKVDDAMKLSILHEMPVLDSKLIKGVSGGWPRILSNLKSLLETGQVVLGDVQTKSSETPQRKGLADYRLPTDALWAAPRAVADGEGGTVIATAEVAADVQRVFSALTTADVENWWGRPDFYRMANWQAELTVPGHWHVDVHMHDGSTNYGCGEFVEIDQPHKLVMTRRFERHPLLGTRETVITFLFDASATGTRITVREEGFRGRAAAAYGNAEHWERVLAWLGDYLASS